MASSESETGSQAGLQGAAPRPVNLPHIESLDVAARYHPARCGGDFFDAVAPDSRVLFMLTDIAGRRPETQAIAVEIQNVFRTRAQDLFEDLDANESEGIGLLARDINRSLIEAARGVRFAPAFLGCYNLTLNILTVSLCRPLPRRISRWARDGCSRAGRNSNGTLYSQHLRTGDSRIRPACQAAARHQGNHRGSTRSNRV